MLFIAVTFICLGSIITLALQFYLIYKFFLKLPISDTPHVPEVVPCELPEELLKYVEGGEWKDKTESCLAINLIFQFLFREWKDTKVMRRWFMKKISREFLDLQRTTTGKLLERVTIRDLQLGNNLPIIKSVGINDCSLHRERKTIEELDLTVDLEYNGGFHLAVDADMVLGRTAFLSVHITKLKGKARLQLTRIPFTHWSISFYDEPYVDFAVESHFQGRPISHVTSLIITQIRRTLRKKHTLPQYKMRFRPFFPLPEPPGYPVMMQVNDKEVIDEGTLEITVVGCTRLHKVESSCHIYCTLALDSSAWVDLVQSRGRSWILLDIEVSLKRNQQFGIVFRQEFVVDKYDYCVIVESVASDSPAASAGIKRNDIIVSIGGTKVSDMKHATKLFKQVPERFVIAIERQSTLKISRSQETLNRDTLLEEELMREAIALGDNGLHTSYVDDYVNITFKDTEPSQDLPKKKLQSPYLPVDDNLGQKEPPKRRVSVGGIIQEFKVSERRCSEGEEYKNNEVDDDGLRKTETQDQLDSSKESLDEVIDPAQKSQNVELKKTSMIKSTQDPHWNEKFLFNLTNQHYFLNLGVWCHSANTTAFMRAASKEPKDTFLGHVSVPLLPVLEECSSNTQGYHIQVFRLQPPDSQTGTRQWKKWAIHSGFDVRLCYGDIILTFLHKPKPVISESSKSRKKPFANLRKSSESPKKQQEKNVPNKLSNIDLTNKKLVDVSMVESAAESEDELSIIEGNLNRKLGAHEFISTHFHSSTVCHFCCKKIWLKVAFQCRSCALICHKKCISRCQSQTSCPPEKAKFYFDDGQDGKFAAGYQASQVTAESDNVSEKEDQLDSNSSSPNRIKSSVSDTPTASPRLRRKKLQGLIANLANAGRSKASMTRTGSAHNLVPPSEQMCPASKSLPPSPQHSPAQSRKSSLQTTAFPWWDPATLEEQDLNSIIEQLLSLPNDEVVLSAAKERGKELYASLLLEERKSKLNTMISKLQEAIDTEAENRSELVRDEHDATNSSQKAKLAFLIAKSDERTQALAVLMLHYLSGLQHCFDQEDTRNLNILSNPEICISSSISASDLCLDSELPSVNICEPEENEDYETVAKKICVTVEDNIEDSDECSTGMNINSVINRTERMHENGWNLENDIPSINASEGSSNLYRRQFVDTPCTTDETAV